MATVADLSVNILANTSGFNPQVDGARAKLNQAFREPVGGVEELAHGLHGMLGQLRGFNSLIELGFGTMIGRKLFEQVHEGIVHFAEGFGEAMSAGEGFFDSMEDGVKHVIGLKTHIEELNERMKENAKLAHDLGGSYTALEELREMAQDRPEKSPEEERANRKLEEVEKKQRELDQAAAPGVQAIADAQARRQEMIHQGFEINPLQDMGGVVAAHNQYDRDIHAAEENKRVVNEARDLRDQAVAAAAQRREEKEDEKALQEADKTRKEQEHQAQEKLNKAIEERANQLKQEAAQADRIRAQDDAMQAFKQQAAEAERLHADHLLTDDEFSTRIQKLQEERMHREGEERKKKGLEPGSVGGAVEAGTQAAQHILAEARQSFSGGSRLVAIGEETNKILAEIRTEQQKAAADKKLDANKTLIADGVASIL